MQWQQLFMTIECTQSVHSIVDWISYQPISLFSPVRAAARTDTLSGQMRQNLTSRRRAGNTGGLYGFPEITAARPAQRSREEIVLLFLYNRLRLSRACAAIYRRKRRRICELRYLLQVGRNSFYSLDKNALKCHHRLAGAAAQSVPGLRESSFLKQCRSRAGTKKPEEGYLSAG